MTTLGLRLSHLYVAMGQGPAICIFFKDLQVTDVLTDLKPLQLQKTEMQTPWQRKYDCTF